MQRKILLLLSIIILLSGCGPRSTPTPGVQTPVQTPAPTTLPTLSPTPLAILILPADMSQADSKAYQKLVYELAQASGMRFQVRNSLSMEEITFEGPALKMVVAVPPDPGLTALAQAAPGVQFLAIGIKGLEPAVNLSSVGSAGLPIDQQAFLAGYIAGLSAPEWRVGILSEKDTPGGNAAVTAFTNGYHFYCGDCWNPNFTQPFSRDLYPIIVRIPTDAPESDYNGYANLLIRNVVRVAYVYPAVATPEVLAHMADSGLMLIGETLPDESLRSNWICSIQPDLITALQSIFPEIAAGQGGQVVSTPLLLVDVNNDLLSEAKMRLVQEVLTGLQNGDIGTGVTP